MSKSVDQPEIGTSGQPAAEFKAVRTEIRRVAVIGAGTMGQGIAQVFAQSGYEVLLTDNRPEVLNAGLLQIERNLEWCANHQLISQEQVTASRELIRQEADLAETVKNADYITECITEELKLKQKIFEQLDSLTPADAILASNTSSLRLSQIGERVRYKHRLIVTHYFNPPHMIRVVEVVGSLLTHPIAVETACEILRRMGRHPVRLRKEMPGFLINRLQAAIVREVLYLLEEEIATADEIDGAVKESIGLRLSVFGPLEVMDRGGLDVWMQVARNLIPQLCNRTEIPAILSKKVGNGELGLKSGRGFYNWNGSEDTAAIDERLQKGNDALLKAIVGHRTIR